MREDRSGSLARDALIDNRTNQSLEGRDARRCNLLSADAIGDRSDQTPERGIGGGQSGFDHRPESFDPLLR
jgi:hypothetical protein